MPFNPVPFLRCSPVKKTMYGTEKMSLLKVLAVHKHVALNLVLRTYVRANQVCCVSAVPEIGGNNTRVFANQAVHQKLSCSC